MNSNKTTGQKSLYDIRALILDMDGVLWRAETPIGDLPAIFKEFERRGWQVVLATNNATRSPEQYLDKLAGYGVTWLERWQIINSAMAAAHYLKIQYPQAGKVFVIGHDGLYQALAEQGFSPGEDDDVVAVVVGMDRNITYEKLSKATLLIRAGAPFIGTNPDRTFPTPQGLVPGTGAILAAIQAATDQQPYILGKPGPAMYRLAMDQLNVKPRQTLAIGDRLETDIAGAQTLGCLTAVVLSGVSTNDEVNSWHPAPDFVADDLTSLLSLLPA
jgi:4-nitrophenyl phosphatase